MNEQHTSITSASLAELDRTYYLHPTTNPKTHAERGPTLIFSSGEGIYVKDHQGESYMDGISMLWNVNLGHGNRELAEVAMEQMTKLAYGSSFAGYSNEPAIYLAEKLAKLSPGDLNTVFYTSGGSEANESAFKLARFYWKLNNQEQKAKIIALENGYHGVTIGAGTATHLMGFHKFADLQVTNMFHAKAHLTNCELGDRSDPDYANSIRGIVEREGAETIAAVILEPVQGSGGVHIPPDGYLQAVRKLCDEYDILLIADEVICGFGRTGQMFGVDHWAIVPDLMCIAKGITSGYAQLGGVLLSNKIRETILQFDQVMAHGFTYSGHPTACALALKTLEIIEREKLVEHVRLMEAEMKKGLQFLEENHAIVTKSRCIGLMAGFELYADPVRGIPFEPTLKAGLEVVEECLARQLILRALGSADGKNIIAIAPPLIISKEEIESMFSILDEAIGAFERKRGVMRR